MLNPLEQFYCDTCQNVIKEAKTGCFEWLKDDGVAGKNHSFRICHNSQVCRKHSNHYSRRDVPLHTIININGIISLLNFLDIGPSFIEDKDYEGPSIKDFREFTEIFRRLSIPYYEECRLYWSQAESDEDNSGLSEYAIYNPDRLKRIIETYSEVN